MEVLLILCYILLLFYLWGLGLLVEHIIKIIMKD
jgi:hypothetical protein